MRVSRDESPDDHSIPNLTPFIDMMFILIVFFLATSKFTEAERDESIRLAQTRSTMPISTPSNLLVINIDKDGQLVVDGRPRTLEQLEEVVRQRRLEKDADVVVRADVRGYVRQLAQTLEICHRLGFSTPNITYANVGE
jgi:biopolymer transport protein ExbD